MRLSWTQMKKTFRCWSKIVTSRALLLFWGCLVPYVVCVHYAQLCITFVECVVAKCKKSTVLHIGVVKWFQLKQTIWRPTESLINLLIIIFLWWMRKKTCNYQLKPQVFFNHSIWLTHREFPFFLYNTYLLLNVGNDAKIDVLMSKVSSVWYVWIACGTNGFSGFQVWLNLIMFLLLFNLHEWGTWIIECYLFFQSIFLLIF